MKTRQEIKLQAKVNMGKQRGTAILIELALVVIGLVSSLLSGIPFLGVVISLAIACIIAVLEVGISGAYISIYQNIRTSVSSVISSLQVNFMRKLGGMLWVGLWAFLWSLLFVIPGIIKAISYSMTSYILAECPNVQATDAIKLSMRITKGYKGELFVAGLSFIGWLLLGMITCGILIVVHVGPYMNATFAGYYIELRNEAFKKGVVRPEELGMAMAN